MAIGQIRKSNITDPSSTKPITPIGNNKLYYRASIIPISEDEVDDMTSIGKYYTTALCVPLSEDNGTTYYTGLTIDRMTTNQGSNDYNLRYDIWLANCTIEQNNNNNTEVTNVRLVQQLKNDIQVASKKDNDPNEKAYIDLVYNKNTDNINCLYVELVTRAVDYTNTHHVGPSDIKIDDTHNPRLDWLQFHCNVAHCIVNNLISFTAKKVGIQSRPGQLIVINKQPIRIGRSGIYEINNDGSLKVKYFSIIPPKGDNNNLPNFIFDYVTENDTEENINEGV